MCVYIANNLTSASVFVFGEMKLNSSCQSRKRLGPSRSFEKRWGAAVKDSSPCHNQKRRPRVRNVCVAAWVLRYVPLVT